MPRAVDATDSRWLSAHLFYQGALDPFLRGVVVPLVRELRERGVLARFFFLRYWQGGPHIRLRLLPTGDDSVDDIRSAVRQSADGWFTAQPSPDILRQESYAEMAKRLARAEPDAGEVPLQANNSVQFVDYRPEHHKYGRGAALDAVEGHFEQSSDLVLELIDREVSTSRRQALAFAALVAAAAADQPGLEQLAERLQRRRQAWSAISERPGQGDGRAIATYRKRREQLKALALSTWRRPWSATAEPFIDGWQRSVDHLSATLGDLERTGQFTTAGASLGLTAPSSSPSTAFAVDNCAHMLCNRMGISVEEETFLRSLAACAASDLGGDEQRRLSWNDDRTGEASTS